MKLKEFINKYEWEFVDFDWAYWNQCVDLARQYAVDVCWINFNARWWAGKMFKQDWWKEWTKYENTPDFVPNEWDIVLFEWPSKYGHIWVVVSADDLSMQILDQNTWDGTWSTENANNRIRIHKYSYKGCQWFVRHISLEKNESDFDKWNRNPNKDIAWLWVVIAKKYWIAITFEFINDVPTIFWEIDWVKYKWIMDSANNADRKEIQ